jgi:c(7)-type cytochrome triheme protein
MMSSVCVFADENVETSNADAGHDNTLTSDASEEEFLEELHYSHEDFVRLFATLPKDEDNKVDWERAVDEGLIAPLASIEDDNVEEQIMDLRVVIKFSDMLIKDVVFSHEVHTYWLNCESCHPKVFIPEVAANRMTMKEIRDGKYCGLCHGVVAFPTNIIDAPNFRANCLRCHRAHRG